jgi:Ca2+-binding RTX toxin-like protein
MNVNFVGHAIETHHIFQKTGGNYHILIERVMGGDAWVNNALNYFHLPEGYDVAKASGMPLHSSEHPWLRDAQNNLLDKFMQRRFDGFTAEQLVNNPNLNKAAYDKMAAAFRPYAERIRDMTAVGLWENVLPLSLNDPHVGEISRLDADNLTKLYLSEDLFQEGAEAALEERMGAFKSVRSLWLQAGLDPGWLNLDNPQRLRGLLDATIVENGLFPWKAGKIGGENSFIDVLNHIDDGRTDSFLMRKLDELGVRAETIDAIDKKSGGKLGPGGKIGLLILAAATLAALTPAAGAQTVEERDRIVKQVAGNLGLEIAAMAARLGLAPEILIAVLGDALISYTTMNPGAREQVDDLLVTMASAWSQRATRFLNGEPVSPGPATPSLVGTPESGTSPFLTGVIQRRGQLPPGSPQFPYPVFGVGLRQDWDSYTISNVGVIPYDPATNPNGEVRRAQVIMAGATIIGFVTLEPQAVVMADGSTIHVPTHTLVLTAGYTSGEGKPAYLALDVRLNHGIVTQASLTRVAKSIIATLKADHHHQPDYGEQQLTQVGDMLVSRRTIEIGPTKTTTVMTAQNGFDVAINSAVIIKDVYTTTNGPPGGAPSRGLTRIIELALDGSAGQAGDILRALGISWDDQGNISYTIDDVPVSEAEAKSGPYRAEFELLEAKDPSLAVMAEKGTAGEGGLNALGGLALFELKARDLMSAGADSSAPDGTAKQLPPEIAFLLLQAEVNNPGDTVAEVSRKLVARRLAFRFAAEGKTPDPQEWQKEMERLAGEQMAEINLVGSIGGVFGSTLGRVLAGDDKVAGVVLSGVLGSLANSVGQGIASGFLQDSISKGYKTGLAELPGNLKGAATGAVSSFITAELIRAVGLQGTAGELANAALGSVIGQIVSSLANASGVTGAQAVRNAFKGIEAGAVWTALGSYVGTKLAAELIEFDTTGGQLGAQIGSSVGGITGTALAIKWAGAGSAWGPVGALVGAFVGYIVGGLIGSFFSGSPRSGAGTEWNEAQGRFVASDAWAYGGARPEAGLALASSAAQAFNGLLDATGGTLLNPAAVNTGHYGMRKGHFVYRTSSAPEKDAIEFKGQDGAQKLLNYGIGIGLSDPDFQIAGGDVYIKRALYNSVARSVGEGRTLDLTVLMGDLAIARDWSFYRSSPGAIEAISGGLEGGEKDTYLAGWVATAARAADLGLDRRHAADWYGGFEFLLRQAGATAASTEFALEYDIFANRYHRSMEVGIYGVTDSVDIAGQTFVELGDGDDLFDLRAGFLDDQRGLKVNGKLNDDIAVAGEDYVALADEDVLDSIIGKRGQVDLTILANSAEEAKESFRVGFTDAQGYTLFGPDATVTIVEHDALPYLQVGRSFAAESDGHAVFRISLSRAAATAISLDLSLGADGATKDEDWTSSMEVSASPDGGWVSATSLTLEAGQLEYFVRVPVADDNDVDDEGKPTGVEGNEQFTLGARVKAGASALSNGDVLVTGTGTIVDGDSNEPLVWMDDVVVHAGQSAKVGFGLSKYAMAPVEPTDPEAEPPPPPKLTVSTSDRRALRIDIAATVDLGAGNDVYHSSDFGDNVLGRAGNDTLYGGRLDDWLFGDDGDDSLNAGSEDVDALGGDGNHLDGGAGNDELIGREGSDWLEGGDGIDILEGGDGGDVLTGGAGHADVLRGGRGNDQYLFRTGDVASDVLAHADIVFEESDLSVEDMVAQAYNDLTPDQITALRQQALTGELFRSGGGLDNWEGRGVQVTPDGVAAGGDDILVLDEGITLEDIKIRKSDDEHDLIIELWPGGSFDGDRVVLKDWFTSFNKVETLRFGDGNEMRLTDFDTIVLGSDGSEAIIGSQGSDFVHAGSGNDIILLLSGHDFGNGGLGNDSVSGDLGDDVVVGAHGDDTLFGGSDHDFVSGGRGFDTVYGNGGNDIVTGGADDDEVIGGEGDDVFKFARGDGHDTFIDALSNRWELVWVSSDGWQGDYRLNPNGTIEHPELGLLYDGQRWLVRIQYDVHEGKLWRHDPVSADAIAVDGGSDVIEFGVGIDVQDLQFEYANDGKDLIVGIDPWSGEPASFASLADKITLKEWGPSGNVDARGTIETFAFFNVGAIEVGDMRLTGGTDGNDVLTGVADEQNWITGGLGNDEIIGDSDDDMLNGNAGRDRLVGLAGADILFGGRGDDVLIGGAGKVGDEGDGLHGGGGDEILLDGSAAETAGDRLIGGEGFDIASYETAGEGVQASFAEPKEPGDEAAGDAAGDVYIGIEALRGSNFVDLLEGDARENQFQGGKGDDELRGALGDDTYVFGRGDGKDRIDDQYRPSRRVLVDGDGDLQRPFVARMNLVAHQGGQYHFEHVVAHEETGEILYRKQLATADREMPMPSTFDPESWTRDFTISGNEVSDDEPEGPAGNDTLLFEDYTGLDGFAGDQTISLSDLLFRFDTGDNERDLLISLIGSSTDEVRIVSFRSGAAANEDRGIETLEFSDGSSVRLAGLVFDASGNLLLTSTDTAEDPVDSFIVSGAASDNLTGGFGDDTLSGGDGNDWLVGGAGDDLLSGGAGYDILHGGDGVDTVTYLGSNAGVTINISTGSPGSGGEASGDNFNSIENIVGSHYNDTLTGTSGDNILKGNRGSDTLSGGLGSDTLIGDEGNDSLTGGVNDDKLEGGAGDDTLNGGGDRDLLSGGDGNDILRGDGVTGIESGANLLVNFSFEDSGDPANDVSQSWGLTTVDLPGWTLGEARPVPLTTIASGIKPFLGTRALNLDDGTGNLVVSQTVRDLALGENISIFLNSAGLLAGNSSGFEILWNGNIVLTVSSGSSSWTPRSMGVTALKGDNKLTIRGIGDVDGKGALIDNVRVLRAVGGADQLIGGAGIDRLEGGSGNDLLVGGDGDDHSNLTVTGLTKGGLYGGAGDDTLDGGAGDDTLDGLSGSDRFVFRTGSGNDTVITGGSGGADELVFEDLSWDRLWFSRPVSTDDLLITAIGGDASVRVSGWFSSASNRARRIVAGAKALSRFDVEPLVAAMTAQSSAVPASLPTSPSPEFVAALAAAWQNSADYVDRAVVIGTPANDGYLFPDPVWVGPVRYEGLGGDDYIDAGDSNDILIGGEGSDTLRGGGGNDEYRFGAEAGLDSVDGMAGVDSLVAVVDSARINLQSLTNVERISGAGFADVQITTGSGTLLDLSTVAVDRITQIHGASGGETIIGSAVDDRIFGHDGDDTLSGGAGDDWIQGGDGADTHEGGDGIDTLDQSHADLAQTIDLSLDQITTGAIFELVMNFENVLGGTGDDTIVGTADANRLDGNDGSDRVEGGGGADLLIGGAGADVIIGGLGVDTASYATQAQASTTTSVVEGVVIDGVVVSLTASSSTDGTAPPATGEYGQQGDAEGDWFHQIEDLEGSDFNDSLTGDDGDNSLAGGKGIDFLYGGEGEDVAVVSGKRADYLISTVGQVTVRDRNLDDGDDGTDHLYDVETIRFADMIVRLGGTQGNNPPQIGPTPLADQIWFDGEFAFYQIPATAFLDPDQDALTFAAALSDGTALPEWLEFDAGTGMFSATPSLDLVGEILEIRVTAADRQFSVSDIFLLTIEEAVGPDIVGTPWDDVLHGTFRRETMIGLSGDDIFLGSRGADRLDGGADLDTADYSASGSPVTVRLTGVGSGGDAAGDQYLSIERVTGSGFADTLTGSADANELRGGAGDDTIDGGDGDDFLDGGLGDDSLSGGGGNDSIQARTLTNGSLDDDVDGGAGADTLYLTESSNGATLNLATGSGNPSSIEHVVGTGLADTIHGSAEDSILSGGLGNDLLSGAGGGDTLSGGSGNDALYGGDGDDLLYGEAGDDRLQGGSGSNTLYGGGGTDTADYRTSGAGLTVFVATGAVSHDEVTSDSFAGGQIENVDGSDFADSLTGSTGANVLKGFAGDDEISGGLGNDHLDGGEGADTIGGGEAADTLIGGGGNDILSGDDGIDIIDGGAGDDLIHLTAEGEDVVDGGAGTDTANFAQIAHALTVDLADPGQDKLTNVENLIAGLNDDALCGSAAANMIDGGGGNDTLEGRGGNDILEGGTGDDILDGGAGADDLRGGDGEDTATYGAAAAGAEFSSGEIGGSASAGVAGVTRTLDGVDIDLEHGSGLNSDAAGDTLSGIETVVGSDAADRLRGSSASNQLAAGTGEDVLYGGGGDDSLWGQSESDILYGGDGADTLDGGTEDDRLFGGAGDDALIGGDGDDILSEEGGSGHDLFDGGAGNDLMLGSVGADVYNGGTGVDTLDYRASAAGVRANLSTAPVNGVAANTGAGGDAEGDTYAHLSIENLTGSDFGDELSGTTSANLLIGRAGADLLDAGVGNDTLRGDSGADTLYGDEGDDALFGGSEDDVLDGGSENDQLQGEGGNDVLDGGTGIDTISGGDGDDRIHLLTTDEDTVDGGAGVDRILFTMTNSILVVDLDSATDKLTNIEQVVAGGGNDDLKGTSGANLLDGGVGDDLLEGRGGADVLIGGHGRDGITYASSAAGASFTSGAIGGSISAGVAAVTRTLNGVDVDLGAGTGANADAAGDTYSGIEVAVGSNFADRLRGTSDNDVLASGSGEDVLYGGAGDDELWSQSENDILYGDAGADLLQGGAGDDRLFGGAGNDTLSGADGNDILSEEGGDGDDLFSGGAGDDLMLGSVGADNYDGSIGADTLDYRASLGGVRVNLSTALVSGVLANTGAGGDAEGDTYVNLTIENVTGSDFADELAGTIAANILVGRAGADLLIGGVGNDTLHGDAGADTLRGDEGADTLLGGSEDDNLQGGSENDLLQGDAGNDILDGGTGIDTISGGDGDDQIHLLTVGEDAVDAGAGVDRALFTMTNATLAIDLTNTAHKLTNVEQVVAGGGNDDVKGSAAANLLDGGVGNDLLEGRGGADALIGGAGDDTASYASSAAGVNFTVTGVGGSASAGVAAVNRTLTGVNVDISSGTGVNADAAGDTLSGIENLTGSAHGDLLRGGGGANILSGGAGDDIAYGHGGNDTVSGGDGHDILFGDGGTDSVQGGAGDDRLFGGADNDTLLGGDGNDILSEEGGGGEDLFHGEAGDDLLLGSAGADTYDGGIGTDTLDFSGSSAAVQLNISAAIVNAVVANRGAGGDAEGDTYAAGTIENLTGSAFGDILTGSTAANVLRGGAGTDLLAGGAGNDTLHGDGGADTLRGDAGVDTLHGGAENDTLYGGTENDVLNGDDGDDIINGEDGADTLNGGAGNDILTGGAGIDTIVGGIGDDTIHLTADAEDVVEGGAGIDTASFASVAAALIVDLAATATDKLTNVENLITGSGNDDLFGSALANRLDGGAGDDELEGRGGADILVGGAGIDLVTYASSGIGTGFTSGDIAQSVVNGAIVVAAVNRTLNGVDVDLAAGTAAHADAAGDTFSAIENLTGSSHSDRLRGTSGNTIVSGLAGDDVIFGGAGNDTLTGDGGNDILYGEAGLDTLHGGDGDDRLFGGGEADSLYGGSGNDVLDAGDAGDHLVGGDGNDIMIGGLGEDGYFAARTSGADIIYNYDTDGGMDSVVYDEASGVVNTDLWFSKVAGTRDLLVKVLGTTSAVTIKDWFLNVATGDYTRGSDRFAVDMFVAHARVANKDVNVPQLISIMSAQAEPASFSALPLAVQTQIRETWADNTPPTVTADPLNPTSINEDGTVTLRFIVDDNSQTPDTSIELYAASGGKLQPIAAGDIRKIDESVREVTVKAQHNEDGPGSVTVTAWDGFFHSTALTVSLPVVAVADAPTLGLKALSANAGATVDIDGTLAGGVIALLADPDEAFNSITIENIPIGATLRSGTNSFTATTGSTTATITTWALSTLQLVLPTGSSADFSLVVKATSREPSNGAVSAVASGPIPITVNGTPTAVTLSYASPLFMENVAGALVGTLGVTDSGDSGGTYTYKIVGGVDAAKFIDPNDAAGASQLRLAAGQSLDFEAGSAQIVVRVTDHTVPSSPVTFQQTIGVLPANVNEAPTPLVDINPAPNQVNDTAGPGTPVGLHMRSSDPDGTAIVYAISSDPLGWFAIDSTGLVSVRAGAVIDYEITANGTASINVTASSGGHTVSLNDIVIAIPDVNETPTITLPPSIGMNENVAPGWVVTTITSSDPDKDLLSTGEAGHVYSIVGGSTLFEIVGNQLKTRAGSSFNFESATTSFPLTLRVTDGGGLSSDKPFTVNLVNVNEVPTPLIDTNPAANQVNDTATAGTLVGLTLQSTDPDGTAMAYSISSDPMGWFAINSAGVVSVRAGAVIDYELTAAGTASINVEASSGGHTVSLSNIIITIPDVNETPTITLPASVNMNENVAPGWVVATITSTDPDKDTLTTIGEPSHVYSIVGGSTLFEIVGNQLKTRAGSSFNFESSATSFPLTLRVTDGGGLSSDKPFTINLVNVNEVPTPLVDVNAAANQVNDTAGAGTLVGLTLQSTDPDGTAMAYSLASDQYGWFAINSTTGVVSVRTGAVVDYETTLNGTASINVTATSGGHTVSLNNIVIAIPDVNEAPSFVPGSSASIFEDAPGGTFVAALAASDPDKDTLASGEAGHVYSIVGGSSLFEIVGNQLRTRFSGAFDYDAGPRSYNLTLRVTDSNGSGLSADKPFTVNINNVNESPTDLHDSDWSANWVPEGATGGWGTGVDLWATDPEGVLTYSITNNPFNWFTVNSSTGLVTVRSGAVIDYETTTNGSVSINVQASDGLTSPATLTNLVIDIGDSNEYPSFVTPPVLAMDENRPGGWLVTTLRSSDPDRDNFLNGEAGHLFSIVGGTGASLFEIATGTGNIKDLRTKAGSIFDYESATSYSLAVRVTDNNGSGLSVDRTFTININNLQEGPTVPDPITVLPFPEHTNWSVELSGSVDGAGGEISYDFNGTNGSGNPGGYFAIDNQPGSNRAILRVANHAQAPLDFEKLKMGSYFSYVGNDFNRGYVDIRVVAMNPAGERSPERVIRVTLDNINDSRPNTPGIAYGGTTVFNENSGAGSSLGVLGTPLDPDGILNPVYHRLATNPGNMFEISGGSINAVRNFDYEQFASSGSSTQIVVGVEAFDGVHASEVFNIPVTIYNLDDNLPTGSGFRMENGYTTTLTENSVSPFTSLAVSRVLASDPDGDALTYSIVGGNTANTFAINASGYISAPNGIDYEGMGGAANLGTDGNLVVNLVVRAAQSNNAGRYVDQTLTLNIADMPESFTIWDGSGTLPHGQYPGTPGSSGFAHGYGYSSGFSGGLSSLVHWKRMWRDTNGNGYYGDIINGVSDASLAGYNDNQSPQNWVNPGYRWSGTAWASAFLQELPPIVLDLDGDGQLSSNVAASFDVDGDGVRDRVGWIGTGDAFLVLDRNQNGMIDNGAEISFLSDKPGALSDLDGLSAYDGNHDGRFDASDARFGDFALWQDADQDGISDPGELRSLAAAGLAALSLTGTPNPAATPDTASHVILARSTFTWANGQTGQLGDVALRWDSSPSPAAQSPASASVMPLPAAAMIAIDRDGNGMIDPATEVAGPGLPLSGFDSNGDELISPLDAAYYDLRLWTDENGNQRAEPDEISSLDRAGLAEISTAMPDPSPAAQPEAPAPATEAPAQPVPAAASEAPAPEAEAPAQPEPAAGASAGSAGQEDERRFRAMLAGLGDLRGRRRTDALIEAAVAAEAGSPLQSRIVQAMAGFGARGAAETMARDPVSPHVFSLHAAS